jgi:hypothetical protein
MRTAAAVSFGACISTEGMSVCHVMSHDVRYGNEQLLYSHRNTSHADDEKMESRDCLVTSLIE